MTNDRFTKILLSIVAAMLFINLLYAVFAVSRLGGQGGPGVAQYLLSSWSVQSGAHTYHAGSLPGPARENGSEGKTNMQREDR